ncbi:hypothetical protein PR202_gb11527 [Eleusine coracana subsp. coracana]|uniref:[RNA-polymerase]-subunit kinase n=1 Tax=Eleusine coracana subsp. coracana TaxID=191504 RepID=A0AAV5EMH0_ELECO|nr:hypothetical protein QOZ80_3BG0267980 [Eleusine coracana subsp. coracana]GJN23840.1 hypothetical protein PR202_gb11527 [Eleusine coracana subsp. coracana]
MAGCSRKRFAVGSTEEYEETCCLGEGGYGTVIKARHRVTGQFVAIKRLCHPGQGQPAVMREKSFLEACSGNPFIVGFHGLVRAPDSMELRLVMEHIGPSLRDVLLQTADDEPPFPEATVRGIMWQLLTGAKKMHGLHIVHRDIKPENILLSADDQSVVKICDFGLALRMSNDAPPYYQVGTGWYMAPEMLLGKTDYDALVDTWSLGCVMAELIDGCVLFHALNDEGQLCAIIDVLGVPDARAWPWLSSTPFAKELLPQLQYARRRNGLRKRFPETLLSEQGFEVLSGLLTWNPDKRLTASAALKHPWFAADLNAPRPAKNKEDLTSTLPKMMDPLIVRPNLHKRQKLQCV